MWAGLPSQKGRPAREEGRREGLRGRGGRKERKTEGKRRKEKMREGRAGGREGRSAEPGPEAR